MTAVTVTCVVCKGTVEGILTDVGTGGFYLAKSNYGNEYAVCDSCHESRLFTVVRP